MLLESLATAGRSIAVIAFKDVSWEINVLLEGQLAAKPPTALGVTVLCVCTIGVCQESLRIRTCPLQD